MSRKQKNGKTIVQTDGISDVRDELQIIADKTAGLYADGNDLKAAELALKAYNGAVSAAKAQLIYKKLTGTPGSITFFEE